MRKTIALALLLIFAQCISGMARQVTDTLRSKQGDTVIISYDVVEKGEATEVRFIDVTKKLGPANNKKYNKDGDRLSYVKVLCFDREDNLTGIIIKGHLSPELFMIPEKGDSYIPSENGYFILDDDAVLRFGHPTEPFALSIPIFLAQYKDQRIKKLRPYELFERCGNLEIKIDCQKPSPTPTPPNPPDPIPSPPSPPDPPIEPGAGLTEIETQALSVANYILEQLEDSNPDYESLKQDVKELGKNKGLIQNKDVVERIETVEQTFKKAYQRHEHYQDSIGSLPPEGPGADPSPGEPENRSNLWMFIGAALLAILMFVGNQVMQSIRAKKNQVSMAKAQQEAMKKAQEMARQQQQQLQQQANGNTPDPNKKRYTI